MPAREVESDDEIYQFDRVWLGPTDASWIGMFEATYTTWAIALVTFVAALVPLEVFYASDAESAFGVIFWAAGIAIAAAMLLGKRLTPEVSLKAIAQAAVGESTNLLAAQTGSASEPRPIKCTARSIEYLSTQPGPTADRPAESSPSEIRLRRTPIHFQRGDTDV